MCLGSGRGFYTPLQSPLSCGTLSLLTAALPLELVAWQSYSEKALSHLNKVVERAACGGLVSKHGRTDLKTGVTLVQHVGRETRMGDCYQTAWVRDGIWCRTSPQKHLAFAWNVLGLFLGAACKSNALVLIRGACSDSGITCMQDTECLAYQSEAQCSCMIVRPQPDVEGVAGQPGAKTRPSQAPRSRLLAGQDLGSRPCRRPPWQCSPIQTV